INHPIIKFWQSNKWDLRVSCTFWYSYDCGVFVLKFLSAVDNEILWKDTKYFENLPQYRKSTMLDLLKWEKNSIKG
ncbi:hypothetical protein KSS87_012934, partial [Heliosperma pusillum]